MFRSELSGLSLLSRATVLSLFVLASCGTPLTQSTTSLNGSSKGSSDATPDPSNQPVPPISQQKNPDTHIPEKTFDELYHEALALVAKEDMAAELSYIADDEFKGRLSGTKGNIAVADYLINNLKDLNIKPAAESGYRQTFTIKNGPTRGKQTSNIIAALPGQDALLKNEVVVIGAHMDHTGTLSKGYTCSQGASGSSNICNGADDNGSGTISVLNVAKALNKVREHLKRTVVIMWFSGEELGLEGSWHYTRNPIYDLNKTAYMINMDMVGYMSSYNNSLAALGSGTSRVAEDNLRKLQSVYTQTTIEYTPRAGGGSDHVPFMSAGIPGVFFHTGVSNNRNYHRTSDTPDKIDYEGMVVAAKIAFEQLFFVANDERLSMGKTIVQRTPLVTEEEKLQSCHHLILNPFIDRLSKSILDGNY